MSNLKALTMPKWGIEMVEGTIAEWHVKAGDPISKGQVVALVETDKIANDLEVEYEASVGLIVAEAGSVYPVGALLADVPHSRPVNLIGTATDQELIDRFDLQRSRYEGPTGIVGVLQDAFTTAGVPTMSLWAAVPAYASQVPSSKAALALVERTCAVIGTPVAGGALGDEVAEYEERVDALVSQDDDLVGYVHRLETMADAGLDTDTDDEDDDDDDSVGGEAEEPVGQTLDADGGDRLIEEVEQFLRDQGKA